MIIDNRKRERIITIEFTDINAESPYELDNLVDEIRQELNVIFLQRKVPSGIKIKAEIK